MPAFRLAKRDCIWFLLVGLPVTFARESFGQEAVPTTSVPSDGPAQKATAEAGSRPTIELPRLLSEATVPYPDQADGDALVVLKLLIETDGTVSEAEVLAGAPPFSIRAQRAALSWRFTPATVGGVPRAAHIKFSVEFVAPVDEPQVAQASSASTTDQSEVQEIRVVGTRLPGTSRVTSDAETHIIPGAEGDPVRAIEAMPGTVPILASGPFLGIRGSSPAMVSYQFDGISVPYLFHLARGTSVISPWLVSSAAMYGTGGPARLGRSTAGTLEARAAEPENRLRAHARVRLTDSAAGAEAPLWGGKGDVLLAGRYSYTRPLVSLIAPDFTLNYWDYQLRTRLQLGSRDYIEFLGFGAGDHSAQKLPDGSLDDLMNGSFHRASLRYVHLGEEGEIQRVSLTYGHDRWDARPEPIRPRSHFFALRYEGEHSMTETSGRRTSLTQYGAETQLRFQKDDYYDSPEAATARSFHRKDVSAALWLDEFLFQGDFTELNLGIRGDLFVSESSPLADQAIGWSINPRFALEHQVSHSLRLRTSFGLNSQLRSPAQLPPGRLLTPNHGLQYGALSDFGAELQLPAGLSLDASLFHNAYFNVMDAEALLYLRGQVRDSRAQGHAYGLEVALKRMLAEDLKGFLAYTQTYATRSIGRVTSAAPFERRHVFDLALAYDFGRGWGISSRATYYTGYQARMQSVQDLDGAPRTQPYFQLDLQGEKRFEIDSHGRYWAITAGILNATLSSDSNDFDCTSGQCFEERVGPATVPTIGIEGEL